MTFEHVKGRLEVAVNLQDPFFHTPQEALIQQIQEVMGDEAVKNPRGFLTRLLEEIQNNESFHFYGGLLHASHDLLNELS